MAPDAPTTPYRDEKATLAWRLENLHKELAEIRGVRLDLEAVTHRETEILSEITQLTTEIAKTRAKRNLPLLDMAYVASPCKADWNEMAGDDRTRFCGLCNKNVHNLSAMSFEDAEAFLRELTGEACVRLYRRKDGTVMTNDCPVGVRNKRVKRAAAVVASAGMAAAGMATMHSETAELHEVETSMQEAIAGGVSMPIPEPEVHENHPVPMGTVAMPPPPPRDTPPRLIGGPSTPINPQGLGGTMAAQCTITKEGRARDCGTVLGPPALHPAMRSMLAQQVYAPATHEGKPIAAPYVITATLDTRSGRTGGPAGAPGAAGPQGAIRALAGNNPKF